MMWTHDAHHETRFQAQRIRSILREVPDVLDDIEPAPRPGGGRSSGEPKLPISKAVMDAKDVLHNCLVGWARVLREDFGAGVPLADDSRAIAYWLRLHADQLAFHPASDDAEQELQGAVDGVQRLVDRPQRTMVGPCSECGTFLYSDADSPTVRCPMCAQLSDVMKVRAENLVFVRERFFPAADLARILTSQGKPVKASTIRKWGARGKLGGYCRIDTKRALYRAADVIWEVEELMSSGRSRSRRVALHHRRESVTLIRERTSVSP